MKRIAILMITVLSTFSSFAGFDTDGVDPTKTAFEKWTKSFVQYPQTSTIQKQEGVVYVSFEISINGEMENAQIEKSVSTTLDQKAIEMVGQMPKEHLYDKGFIEGTRFILPVKFIIE